MSAGSFFNTLGKSLSALQSSRAGKGKRPVLYLHIGLPKTGTSAIQNFFFRNQKVLQQQGVLYPDFALHWSQHVPVAKAILSPIFPDAHFNRFIESVDMESWHKNLLKSCVQNRCSKVVVSSEFFWAAPAMQSALEYHASTEENFDLLEQAVEACKTAFSWFDKVKVIVYLRRQDQWLESFFNQQIKDGFSIPKEQELLPCKNYLLYARNLRLWEKHFGRENILVRNFSECNGDVVKDFCRMLSIHKDEGFVPQPVDAQSANLRLSPRAVKAMRLAIEHKVDKELLDLLGEVLRYTSAKLNEDGQGEPKGVFSSDFHWQVLSVYEQDNYELADRYPICSDFCRDESPEQNTLTTTTAPFPEEQIEILLERLLPAYVAAGE